MILPLNFKYGITDVFLVLSLLTINLFILGGIAFSYSGLFACGNDFLLLWEEYRTGFLIVILLIVLQLFFCFKIYKTRTKILAIGCWFIIAFSVYLAGVLGIETFDKSKYYQPFDTIVWKRTEEKPLAMIRVFIADKRFTGWSKQRILKTLGPGNSWRNKSIPNKIYYATEAFESPLVIEFKNDKVIACYLSCYE